MDETGAASSLNGTHGKMVVFVNTKFAGSTENSRQYALHDINNLRSTFVTNLGFDWLNKGKGQDGIGYKDITSIQWDHRKASNFQDIAERTYQSLSIEQPNCCLRCLILGTDYSDTDYFLLAVSSHGRDNGQGLEIMLFDNQWLKLSDILEVLSESSCPALKDKPKILLLHCCRTKSDEQAAADGANEAEDDGNEMVQSEDTQRAGSDDKQASDKVTVSDADAGVPEDTDTISTISPSHPSKQFLIVYAVAKGKRAKSNEREGSWMIQAISEVVSKEVVEKSRIDFLRVLTKASDLVAQMETRVKVKNEDGTDKMDEHGKPVIDVENSGKKNAICIEHRLTRPVIFYRKKTAGLEQDIPDPLSLFGSGKKKKRKTGLVNI